MFEREETTARTAGSIEAKQSHVQQQMSRLANVISRQHELLTELEKRLFSVLRGESPTEALKETNPRDLLVIHAAELETFSLDIVAANRFIESLIERLEL